MKEYPCSACLPPVFPVFALSQYDKAAPTLSDSIRAGLAVSKKAETPFPAIRFFSLLFQIYSQLPKRF